MLLKTLGHAKSWAHYWVCIYNEEGPDGITKKRLRNQNIGNPKITQEIKQDLFQQFQNPFPKEYGGGAWSGPNVKKYLVHRYQIQIHRQSGWLLLRESGMTLQTCRPHHADTLMHEQRIFKKKPYLKP